MKMTSLTLKDRHQYNNSDKIRLAGGLYDKF